LFFVFVALIKGERHQLRDKRNPTDTGWENNVARGTTRSKRGRRKEKKACCTAKKKKENKGGGEEPRRPGVTHPGRLIA